MRNPDFFVSSAVGKVGVEVDHIDIAGGGGGPFGSGPTRAT